MKVKYNTGGKSPVDPPKSRPNSDATYSLGGNYFYGQEADRLGAFSQYLAEKYPALDGDELNNQQLRIEEMERFINSGAYKSDDAMRAYEVDPSNFAPGRKSNLLGEESSKPKSVMDEFESAFGSSPFGGSDPFEDDPDIQRMREEAAARDKKKGKRKRFEQGGKVNDMKVKYGKGGSAKEMYATGGMLKALLADPKQAAMAREILAEMGAKIPEYKEGGKNDPTSKMKKSDEAEIDRRYEVAVGTNPKTGALNYPNSSDMDKYDATAGEGGDPDKLRKAISDEYYAEKRKEMGVDKVKTYDEGGEVTGPMVVVKGKKGDGVREVRTLEKGGEELIGMVSDRMQRMMINSADANLNKPEFRADYEKVMGMIGKGGSVADVSKALTYLEGTDLGTQMTKGNPTFMEDLRKDIFKMKYAIPSKGSEKGFRYLTDEEAAEYEKRKGKKF